MSINQSLAHGLNILLLYEASAPLFTVSEISKRLGYSQSKTYRLVRTLTQYDLLREENGTAQYTLGLNTLRLGLLAKGRFNLSNLAKPFMKELSFRTKETVLLTAINGTRGVVLERVESEEPVRFSLFQPGVTLPLHCGASSKILMAYLPEKEWDHIISKEGLKRYTSHTITEVDQLKAHLRQIRKRRVAFSDQEVDRDVRAVASPILDPIGELVAGLSIAGPVYRISKRRVNELSKLVKEYAEKISSQLRNESTLAARGGSKNIQRKRRV
jgi:DNA-binding IclR family transcriptional regulator